MSAQECLISPRRGLQIDKVYDNQSHFKRFKTAFKFVCVPVPTL